VEFVCKIGSNSGEVMTRLEQATSEAALRQRLMAEGYLVFSIHSRGGLGGGIITRRRKKIKPDDFLIFNQQFLTLSRSGLSLQKAIDLLVAQTRTDELKEALEGVREQLRGGKLLSEAFEAVGCFPKVYCANLRAGERSGSLDKVLEHYVKLQRASRGFRKKFISALIYPSILICFLAVLITVVVTFIVPKFALLYNDLGVELPAMTLFVIALSKNLNRLAIPILIGIGASVAGVRSAFRRESTRLAWDRFKFKVPKVGPLLLKFSVAEFGRTLATLLRGGLPIMMALKTTCESVSSPLVARALEAARKEVLGGQSLYNSLKANVFFPPMALDMVEVGESTGALPDMLENLSEFYEEDVEIDLARIVSLVDPIVLGVIACVVAFILIAFYLPLFNLASQVH
jgi:type IV pilus assembly protein PilC